jgi:hypothetical protein
MMLSERNWPETPAQEVLPSIAVGVRRRHQVTSGLQFGERETKINVDLDSGRIN